MIDLSPFTVTEITNALHTTRTFAASVRCDKENVSARTLLLLAVHFDTEVESFVPDAAFYIPTPEPRLRPNLTAVRALQFDYAALQAATGITKRHLFRPSVSNLLKLARYCGVPLDSLLTVE